ncbi:MAG: SMEK domain-containing protein [Methylococcaceae bacterium]|nr:SMEK domain-containing protein [Methylococcaceae bacterium]
MKHLELQSEFRELISQLRHEVEAASAMQLYDSHRVGEQVICGLLRELYGYAGMRSLNVEKSNFPGIDLADDTAHVAVQVTGTADLTKMKHTLETFVRHNLHQKYGRLIVYVLTTKQGSYSQSAIDTASDNQFSLHADRDIWDYRELCTKAAEASPKSLQAAINHLKAYLRGVPIGLANEDIDPPMQPEEMLVANLQRVYFPSDLHIAQLNTEIMDRHKKVRSSYLREAIRLFCKDNELSVPSGYVAHAGALITFMDLTDSGSPYRHLIEPGTHEVLSTKEFWEIDQDYEKVLKSLLRFSLQQRLFSERVLWYNNEKQFVFLPRETDGDMRIEGWQGDKYAKRKVFVRQHDKKGRTQFATQKHLSFSVKFQHIVDEWLMSITPSWFFSYGEDFRKSGFGYKNLSWLKRQENNRAVFNHFRFISAWLRSIDQEDLFSQASERRSFLSFGDHVSFDGAPALDESKWVAFPDISDAGEMLHIQRLVG